MSDDALSTWDRRPRETARAYAAFIQYRDLGPARSLRKQAALEKPAGPFSSLADWSRRFDWVDRAGAWDEHLDREERLQAIEDRRKMRSNHARVGRIAIAKAAVALDGINPGDLTPREAIALAKIGTEIERKSLGEPDVVVESHRSAESDEMSSDELWAVLKANPDLADALDALDDVAEAIDESASPS